MNPPFRRYKPAPGQWSLRNRLVVGVVILGALGIAASDFAAQTAFRTFLIAQVDAQLESVAGGSLLRLDRAGNLIDLSPTEFILLRYLMINADRVVSKSQILDHVWQYDFRGDAGIVETYISYLRKKIDQYEPPLIHSVRGVGYRLRLPAQN